MVHSGAWRRLDPNCWHPRVAGCEAVAPPDALTLLDPNPSPGLGLNGASLQVNGSVAVNSQGAGTNETNASVNWGQPSYVVTAGNSATLSCTAIRVVGGVDYPGAFQTLGGGSGSLQAGVLPRPTPCSPWRRRRRATTASLTSTPERWQQPYHAATGVHHGRLWAESHADAGRLFQH